MATLCVAQLSPVNTMSGTQAAIYFLDGIIKLSCSLSVIIRIKWVLRMKRGGQLHWYHGIIVEVPVYFPVHLSHRGSSTTSIKPSKVKLSGKINEGSDGCASGRAVFVSDNSANLSR